MAKFLEGMPIKVKAPEREPGTIPRRTDFTYMNGRGTFYRFDGEHFPKSLLRTKRGDEVKLIMYNLHTDQLDEVAFKLISRFSIGEKYFRFLGEVDAEGHYFEIRIDYFLPRPLESHILVFASAPRDYSCFQRL